MNRLEQALTRKLALVDRLYRNWPVHNIIGHPLMGVCELLRREDWAKAVHDGTLPPKEAPATVE